MDELEMRLREGAIYGQDSWQVSDVRGILEGYELELVSGQGMFSYVYRVCGTDWMVKEGRWNVDLKLVGEAKVPVPGFLSELVFKGRGLPKKGEVLRQYAVYLQSVRYLGYFSNEEDYWHPNLDEIWGDQKQIRDGLVNEVERLCKRFRIKEGKRLKKILSSKMRYTNFLPKEYLLAGESLHKSNEGKVTSFIFQKFVPGETLHDVDWRRVLEDKRLRDELVVLIVLLLVFYDRERLLVDTRPKHPATELHDWLMKTDNIFANEEGFWLVDTRWCWSAEDDFVNRGLVIPNLAVQRWAWCLNRLLHPEGKGEPLPDVETFVRVGVGRTPFDSMRTRAERELRKLWERMQEREVV